MNPGRSECAAMLRRCLAIVVRKEGCQGNPGDFWMYESGYLLFQGLLSANSVCWWNTALNGATKTLEYRGYISPGAILVNSEPCALEVLRGAWARRVLQPPAGYQIVSLEDIEDCTVTTVMQTQWTPLPEAVCAVILRLSSQGRPAGIETIREALTLTFPHVSPPSERALYDTLVQLKTERKLYHTSRGYFIVTPERRRSRSHSRGRSRKHDDPSKTMLMSTEEALALAHGEMNTFRDGDVTHQCIQTNLADVICGGNPSDKILYSRNFKRRSASFPAPKSPDRRGSFKLWSSTRRLKRSASTRTIARHHYTDSSSSTEYPNSSDSTKTPKKESLLSRLFRRSRRSQCQISTFSAQFPPTEWFNSKAVHLHNVGTQTTSADEDNGSCPSYCLAASERISSKSATLPRRHRRQLSTDSTYVTSHTESREHSPNLRYRTLSQAFGSLPRSMRNQMSPNKSYDSSRKTSRSSLSPKISLPTDNQSYDETKLSPQIKSMQRTESKTSSKESLKNISLIGSDEKLLTDPDKKQGDASPYKTFSSLDNSGPSSLESHKSSKAGSSITSGTSSLESHKTVIQRPTTIESKSYKKTPKRKESFKAKQSPSPNVAHKVIPKSNSFTLQVTTKNGGIPSINNGTSPTNTKIYVQNSPVCSVITFENGQSSDNKSNLVIINGTEPVVESNNMYQSVNNELNASQNQKYSKNTNTELNNSQNIDAVPTENRSETMNNSRKLSLQMPNSKEGLSYQNFLKNVSSPTSCEFKRNTFDSVPSSPLKNYEDIQDAFSSKLSLDKSFEQMDKNILSSDPNISCKDDLKDKRTIRDQQFPSLSDLSFNFTSLAAQKILNGVSINSIDTLVELNMAANGDRKNNCDVVHTDFGLV